MVVDLLNRMRPSVLQAVNDVDRQGSIVVYHTNDWTGARLSGAQWGVDLAADVAQGAMNTLANWFGAQSVHPVQFSNYPS